MDYAALFFTKILEVFDYPERTVAQIIETKMQQKRTTLLNQCQNELERCHKQSNPNVRESYFDNILFDLKKLKELGISKQLYNLPILTEKLKGINLISEEHYEQVSLLIAEISSSQLSTGYSAPTIHTYKKTIPNGKIQGLYDYFLQYESFSKDIIDLLVKYLNCEEFNDIPRQTIMDLTTDLYNSISDNSYIYKVFRRLSLLSKRAHKQDAPQQSLDQIFTTESEEGIIYKKIMSLIDANWAGISPEVLGITQLEFNKIKSTPLDQLMDDYYFIQNVLPDGSDVFQSDSFNAILKYRLYNVLYTWNSGLEEKEPIRYEENNDQYEYPAVMKVAVALLGKALEGASIFIHPAARISSPIYIGHHTMIGKQCTIGHDSILGNNVCLYPFNTKNKKHLDEYIVLGNYSIVFSNTRVLGTISFGDQCVLTSSLITGSSFSNNVVDKCGIENGLMSILSDESITQYRNELINDLKKEF